MRNRKVAARCPHQSRNSAKALFLDSFPPGEALLGCSRTSLYNKNHVTTIDNHVTI